MDPGRRTALCHPAADVLFPRVQHHHRRALPARRPGRCLQRSLPHRLRHHVRPQCGGRDRDAAHLEALRGRRDGGVADFAGAGAALLAFGLLGKPILGLFGDAFIAGYGALLVLTAAQLMQALVGPVSSLLGISGHQDHCLYVFGITLVIAIVLNMLLLPSYGIMGAAVVVVLSVAFWTIWLYRLVRRFLDVDPSVIGLRSLLR